jgi:GNAT superfamily N-acetyltransferase
MLGNLFGDSAEGQAVATYHQWIGDYGVHHFPAMRYYLGEYAGELVATGTLFVGSDTVGIYDIVTHPDYRHRGIGSAMFAHLLREAQAWPDRPAVLQASPDGIGIYRRAGFTPVGEVHVFERRSPEAR